MRHALRALAAGVACLGLMTGTAFADQAPSNPQATAAISDNGFLPPTMIVPAGTLVNWSNQGAATHSVTSDAGSDGLPLFDSSSLRPGDSFSYLFSKPGVYTYHSSTDARYDSSGKFIYPLTGTVVVGSAPASAAVAAPPPPPPMQAVVSVTDSGFSPPSLTVALGATVTWVNQGNVVHTASSIPQQPWGPPAAFYSPNYFDSGGLAPGQSFSFTFGRVGRYSYTSLTDQNPANQMYTMSGLLTVVDTGSGGGR